MRDFILKFLAGNCFRCCWRLADLADRRTESAKNAKALAQSADSRRTSPTATCRCRSFPRQRTGCHGFTANRHRGPWKSAARPRSLADLQTNQIQAFVDVTDADDAEAISPAHSSAACRRRFNVVSRRTARTSSRGSNHQSQLASIPNQS